MSWKSFLKDYFNFSRAERFGVLALCGCILLTMIVRWSLPYLTKPKVPDISVFAEEIARFRRAIDSVYLAKDLTESTSFSTTLQPTSDLFYFDPNKASDKDWEKLGLNERQIRNIRNYQASGGNFRRKEDLQKLYTISSTQYQLLEPYIRFAANTPPAKQVAPEIQPITVETERTAASNRKLQIELNTADSSLLTKLTGIGPVLASRTIRYRNRIGGFVDVAQLGEVYGISEELVEQLASQLSADSLLVRKISMNRTTFRELVNHPYLNEQQVRGILNYRNLQNRIDSLHELVRNNILTREDAEKIRPYLTFD